MFAHNWFANQSITSQPRRADSCRISVLWRAWNSFTGRSTRCGTICLFGDNPRGFLAARARSKVMLLSAGWILVESHPNKHKVSDPPPSFVVDRNIWDTFIFQFENLVFSNGACRRVRETLMYSNVFMVYLLGEVRVLHARAFFFFSPTCPTLFFVSDRVPFCCFSWIQTGFCTNWLSRRSCAGSFWLSNCISKTSTPFQMPFPVQKTTSKKCPKTFCRPQSTFFSQKNSEKRPSMRDPMRKTDPQQSPSGNSTLKLNWNCRRFKKIQFKLPPTQKNRCFTLKLAPVQGS